MRPGDRLRVRSAGRRELAVERGNEAIGVVRLWIGEVSIRVGGHEYLFEPGDGWDVELRNTDGTVVARHDDRALRDDLVVAGDRAYTLELPTTKRAGELRDEDKRCVAALELRLPDHGAVLLADVREQVHDAAIVFVATIALLRGMAGAGGRKGVIPGDTSGKAWDRTIEFGVMSAWG